jgi:hypothetical protein
MANRTLGEVGRMTLQEARLACQFALERWARLALEARNVELEARVAELEAGTTKLTLDDLKIRSKADA